MTVAVREYFLHPPSTYQGEVKIDEPLARYTYYQIGGPARVLFVHLPPEAHLGF